AARAEKATRLHEYEPTTLERRILMVESMFTTEKSFYPYIGSVYDGGGMGVGPGYRTRFADSGTFDAHAALSVKNFKTVDAQLRLPDLANGRLTVQANGNWLDAPSMPFNGVGNDSSDAHRDYAYRRGRAGAGGAVRRGWRRHGHAGDYVDRHQPDLPGGPAVRGVRLAELAVVHAQGRPLSHRLVGLSRHERQRPQQLSPPRRRG